MCSVKSLITYNRIGSLKGVKWDLGNSVPVFNRMDRSGIIEEKKRWPWKCSYKNGDCVRAYVHACVHVCM